MTKKILLKLHLYLSLPLGVVIMLICLSGATLVFKNEIRNALEMPKVIAPHAKSIKGDHDIKGGDEERVGKTIGKFSSKDAPYGTTTKRDFFSYVTKFHTSLMMVGFFEFNINCEYDSVGKLSPSAYVGVNLKWGKQK